MISLMILSGFVLMYSAIYSKNKDIEMLSFRGLTELFLVVVNLVFNLSKIRFKRILIFVLGFFWSSFFLIILITGRF